MPRLTPKLARRIDRLAARAHRFHRFAHHPLCARYAGELIRVGSRTAICRGCTLAATGALAGFAAGLAVPVPPAGVLGVGVAAVAFAGWFGVHGRVRRKLLTRSLPLAIAAAVAILGVRVGGTSGAAIATAAVTCLVMATIAYQRRGPDRSRCDDCEERVGTRSCSGFRAIARREAAFARAAGRLLHTLDGRTP